MVKGHPYALRLPNSHIGISGKVKIYLESEGKNPTHCPSTEAFAASIAWI